MKNRLLINILTLFCIGLASCSSGGEGTVVVVKAGVPKEVGSVSTTTTLVQLDTVSSQISWVGRKPGGVHSGTLKLQRGYFEFSGQEMVGGRVIFNMSTISDVDLSDSESRVKLEKHLKSADFFNIAQYPTSDFVITKITSDTRKGSDNFTIEGNLTIKGITKSIAFPGKIVISDKEIVAQVGPIAINRTDWGVNYGSKSIFDNLKDKFIDDNIELTFSLEAAK